MTTRPQPGDFYLGSQTGNVYYIFANNQFVTGGRFIRVSTTREPVIDSWDSFQGFEVSEDKINSEYAHKITKAIFIAEIKK